MIHCYMQKDFSKESAFRKLSKKKIVLCHFAYGVRLNFLLFFKLKK